MPYHGEISHIFGAKYYSTDFALIFLRRSLAAYTFKNNHPDANNANNANADEIGVNKTV